MAERIQEKLLIDNFSYNHGLQNQQEDYILRKREMNKIHNILEFHMAL